MRRSVKRPAVRVRWELENTPKAKQDAAGAFSGALSAAEEHLLHALIKKHRENRNEHALYNIKRNDRKQDQR